MQTAMILTSQLEAKVEAEVQSVSVTLLVREATPFNKNDLTVLKSQVLFRVWVCLSIQTQFLVM